MLKHHFVVFVLHRKDKASEFDPLLHVGNLDIVVMRVDDEAEEPYYVGQVKRGSIHKDTQVSLVCNLPQSWQDTNFSLVCNLHQKENILDGMFAWQPGDSADRL